MELVNLGLVVQKPFNPNPRSLFLNSQVLFNADIRQHFTLAKVNFRNKIKQKKLSTKSWPEWNQILR